MFFTMFICLVCNFGSQLEELKGINGDAVNLIRSKSSRFSQKVVPDEPIDVQRREKVKEAMVHAWSSYEKYAWGRDELQVKQIKVLIICF